MAISSMGDAIELPEDVITAIRAHRKIAAIKLLREHRGVGLKEAKHAVEAYMAMNPSASAPPALQTDSGLGRLVLVCFLAAVGYAVYRFLS